MPDDPDAFEGANLKQARAAEAVLALANALRELPPFHKSKGVAVLHEIAGAFNDVVHGGSPRLFTATRAGKQGGDGTDRNYVKMRVVIAVRVLMEGQGWSQKKAVAAVTTAFANAGAKGRKGGPLAASTVQGWCERIHPLASNPEEGRLHKHVQRNVDDLRAHESWPGTEKDVLDWVDRIANDPLVASKYG